jgi:hypothetical protein
MKKRPMVPQAGYYDWLARFWGDYDRAVRAGEGYVGSAYMPHQGEREKARRRRNMERIAARNRGGLSP